jgi:hypothetical protein
MIRSTMLLMILGQLTWSFHASAQTGGDTTKTHDEAMVNKSQSPDKQLAHDWLFDLAADLEPPLRIGPTPDGMRQIEYVRGGSFQGPSMRGVLLPGGGDWIVQRSDGSMLLDIRATVQTDTGHLIYVNGRGHFYMSEQGLTAAREGREPDAADQYFRVAFSFESGAAEYSWLNRTLAVGVGEYRQGKVKLSVHEIK